MTRSRGPRLEGSQTSPCRLKLREATSGRPLWSVCHDPHVLVQARVPPKPDLNKRLPGTTQGYCFHPAAPSVTASNTARCLQSCKVLDRSREPPVATFWG